MVARFLNSVFPRILKRTFVQSLNKCGLNVSRMHDYYSPLPVPSRLRANLHRWHKQSALVGIDFDLDSMKKVVLELLSRYGSEYQSTGSYREHRAAGYGPGCPAMDAMMLYLLIRHIRPERYIEVGSGLSTFYCSLAANRNAELGHVTQIECIEPRPYPRLYTIPGIQILQKEAQDVETSFFRRLQAGDVLFIDSSHVVKLDGDVPYLYLEVLPRLNKGVIIHVHDVPFPFNTPYPPDYWVLNRLWPMHWNEAMLLQAFLCHNSIFKIHLSLPLLRYYDETFLKENIPSYEGITDNPDTFSSIWIEKIG